MNKGTLKKVWGIVNYSIWSIRNRMDQGLGMPARAGAALNLFNNGASVGYELGKWLMKSPHLLSLGN